MRKAGGGAIVNIASGLAFTSLRDFFHTALPNGRCAV